jgi:hypothetical protein
MIYHIIIPLGHGDECVLRPGVIPIDTGTIDDRRKLPAACPEALAHWRKRQGDMETLANDLDKVLPDHVAGIVLACGLGERSHEANHLSDFTMVIL